MPVGYEHNYWSYFEVKGPTIYQPRGKINLTAETHTWSLTNSKLQKDDRLDFWVFLAFLVVCVFPKFFVGCPCFLMFFAASLRVFFFFLALTRADYPPARHGHIGLSAIRASCTLPAGPGFAIPPLKVTLFI